MQLLTNISTLFALIISDLLCIIIFFIILKRIKATQLKFSFLTLTFAMIISCTGLIAQILFSKTLSIPAIYFEYFIYIGNCLLPLAFLFMSIILYHSKITFNNKYYLLFVIPIISLLFLWTNNYHHLFYINYSIDLLENQYGIIFIIWDFYTLILFAISIFIILKQTFLSSGFFSKQSLLILLGSLITLVGNILTTTKIIHATIYFTPICFTITLIFYAFAIFKFKFLTTTPIAMQKIVDRMSDSFIVVNDLGIITEFNATFINTFNLKEKNIRNIELIKFIKNKDIKNINEDLILDIIKRCKKTTDVILVKKEEKIKDKYFNIEATGIYSNNDSNNYLGCLILLKNVTQHIIDKNIIEDKQSQLIEKERLASLGQMIGGIAHNLKTPIMSISGATEGLLDLTKEYDISIGDPDVTNEDHHAIVADMNEWITKIKTHISYMSDVITAVKGQAVAFSDSNTDCFTIAELLKHVEVLMKHELKHSLIDLNIKSLIPTSVSIKGNISSLVQVINNLISNAIQAYNGQTNKTIDFIINMKENYVIFSIRDYGCGIPEKVKDKLFKEMITTKGKNGTGLGLFMSYSNIRAHFDGEITFESNEGKGTKFDIFIPLR